MTKSTTTDPLELQKMKEEAKARENQRKEERKIERRKKISKFFSSAKDVIIGLWQVLVFASICFSTGIIFAGTDDITLKFLTLPAASYAAKLLFSKFLKK